MVRFVLFSREDKGSCDFLDYGFNNYALRITHLCCPLSIDVKPPQSAALPAPMLGALRIRGALQNYSACCFLSFLNKEGGPCIARWMVLIEDVFENITVDDKFF